MAYNKSSKRKSKYAIGAPKGKTPSRSCNLRKGVFCALRNAKASPFGRGVTEGDGEGKPGTKEHLHSDKHWLLIESSYRCVFVLSQHPCPLRRSAPAPPKGEPLAGRATFRWTLKARYGAKGRALLQRAAASGQRTLSSCRCPRQRSTTVPGTSRFARPGESCPTRQWLPLWGSCHRR